MLTTAALAENTKIRSKWFIRATAAAAEEAEFSPRELEKKSKVKY